MPSARAAGFLHAMDRADVVRRLNCADAQEVQVGALHLEFDVFYGEAEALYVHLVGWLGLVVRQDRPGRNGEACGRGGSVRASKKDFPSSHDRTPSRPNGFQQPTDPPVSRDRRSAGSIEPGL